MASLDPKRQQQQQKQQTPPDYEPFSPEKQEDLNEKNRQKIEDWLNNLKPGFYKYLSDKQFEAATSANLFTHHFLSYLTMYKGEIVGEFLSEGAMEMIFSALGPIGNLWRVGYSKNIEWKMAWMKNPLNANSVYYYLRSLPEQKAFEVALLPIKGVMAIFSHGGGPFTKASYFDHFETDPYKRLKQKYFFTPYLKTLQAAQIVGDGFGKLSGDKDVETIHNNYSLALDNLKQARSSGKKDEIEAAKKHLKFLLDEQDGFFRYTTDKNGHQIPVSSLSNFSQGVFHGAGLSRVILNKFYRNTSRRLKATERDPISYLLALVAGTIWDLTLGLALNAVRVVANQAVNLIPGVRVFRAQLTKFFTSNKWLNSFQVGGATFDSFVRGTFSPTTVSHGILGYQLGSALTPNLFVNGINVGGGIFGATIAGWGAFYNTAVKMANNTRYFNKYGEGFVQKWVNEYKFYKPTSLKGWAIDEGALGEQAIQQKYLKLGRPGPITKFADFLHSNWAIRVPINGWVIGNFLDKFMQNQFGWAPGTAKWIFTGADYLWQIRGPLFDKIGDFITAKEWTAFGKTISNPAWRAFSINNPGSLTSWVYEKYLGVFYKDPWNFRVAAMAEKPWFKFYNKNVSGFVNNFFNPGFFMGFGISQFLINAGWNPIVAYIAGPLGGSLAWNLSARTLASIFPKAFPSITAGMARINAVGWTGYIIGSLIDLVLPGSQAILGPLLSGVFIGVDIAFALAGKSLIGLVAQGLSSIVGIFSSTAAAAITTSSAIAIWATVTSIAAVAGLTIFFAYTIYAGFWVPMVEKANAGPQSSNFSINTVCDLTGTNTYNCCSTFSLRENVFNDLSYLQHETDIGGTQLSIDLTDPAKTTNALRLAQELLYEPGGFSVFGSMNPEPTNQLYTTTNNTSSVNGAGTTGTSDIISLLSVPGENPQNLFELMKQYPSVVTSMRPFFDILTSLAEEHGRAKQLVAEYKAQLKLAKEQKELVDKLIVKIEDGNLDEAKAIAESYWDPKKHPMGNDPCPAENECPEEKQGLKELYDSWQPMVKRYISTIENYQGQTDPDLTNFLIQLEQDSKALEQQIEMLPDIIDQMEKIQKDMTDEDVAKILATNFSGFSYLPEAEQQAAWEILEKFFPDVFNLSKTYYFIPQSTNYRVCMDFTYSGTIPGEPQTVCSSISYTPSVWGANTGYAKQCTTFTPE